MCLSYSGGSGSEFPERDINADAGTGRRERLTPLGITPRCDMQALADAPEPLTDPDPEPEKPKETLSGRFRELQSSKGKRVPTILTDQQAAEKTADHPDKFAAELSAKYRARVKLSHDQIVWLHSFAMQKVRGEPYDLKPNGQPANRRTKKDTASRAPVRGSLSKGYAAVAKECAAPPTVTDDAGEFDDSDPFAD